MGEGGSNRVRTIERTGNTMKTIWCILKGGFIKQLLQKAEQPFFFSTHRRTDEQVAKVALLLAAAELVFLCLRQFG